MIEDGVATGGVVEDYGILPTDEPFVAFVKRYRNDPFGFAQIVLNFGPLSQVSGRRRATTANRAECGSSAL